MKGFIFPHLAQKCQGLGRGKVHFQADH
jgi:hypothetical protein